MARRRTRSTQRADGPQCAPRYSKNPVMRGRTTSSSQLSHSRPSPMPPPYSPRRRKAARLLQPAIHLHAARPRPGVDHSAGLQCHRHASHLAGPGRRQTLDLPTCADCGRQGGRRGPSVRVNQPTPPQSPSPARSQPSWPTGNPLVRAKGVANHPVGQRNCSNCGIQSGPRRLQWRPACAACEPLRCTASAPSGCAASSGGAAPRARAAFRDARTSPSETLASAAIVPTDFPYRGSVVPPSRTRPDARRAVGRPSGRSVTPLGLPLIDPGQPNACDQKCRHVVDVVPVPLGPLLIRFGLSLPHHTTSLTFRLDVHRGRTLRPPSPARRPLQPTSLIPISVILTAQILTSPAIPTPSRFTSPETQQQLSRPARRHRLRHRDPRGAVCRRAHRRLRHPVLHLSTCDTTSLWSSLGWLPRLNSADAGDHRHR